MIGRRPALSIIGTAEIKRLGVAVVPWMQHLGRCAPRDYRDDSSMIPHRNILGQISYFEGRFRSSLIDTRVEKPLRHSRRVARKRAPTGRL